MQSQETVAAELELAFEQLAHPNDKFPEKALRTVKRLRDVAIPRLIESLEQATAIMSTGGKAESSVPFFAIVLLTEFKAREAWPAIRNAISLPGEGADYLFGGVITETLPSIIALFCADSIDTVDELISDRSINEYVRGSAARSFLQLVRDGRIRRDNAVQRLRTALNIAILNQDRAGVNGTANALYEFAPIEAIGEIREAFKKRLADPMITSLEDFEQCCKGGHARFEEEIARCGPTGVADTVDLLRHWY